MYVRRLKSAIPDGQEQQNCPEGAHLYTLRMRVRGSDGRLQSRGSVKLAAGAGARTQVNSTVGRNE